MRRVLIGLAVVACSALVLASPSVAARAVSGAWSSTAPPVYTCFAPIGGGALLCATQPFEWTGDFAGTTVSDLALLVRPDGSSFGFARERFTGSVSGIGSGTMDFFDTATGDPFGNVRIVALSAHGTGDLAGHRARLVFVGVCQLDGSCVGTYTGSVD